MQQLDIFALTPLENNRRETGFKYRRRLYNNKDQYLYTVIPTENGFKLNRIQALAEDIGILNVNPEEYERFKAERGLIEKLPKDVRDRMERDS